ncbi:hypothetical protein [Streptomyces sp. RKAG293]|uniref:hypothetical protein n=1 Tax=Streptomyces sp. RKAG293 TaxID=2893403 RepID=UPI00203367C6|nr:hypothetical protein [Streptomyces sp. RKAG293]MCM2416915.1 hypothetical protein [Streptomyces sp. RKAG293]
MANPDDEKKTPHAPGSQPSTRPGSDEPQTITAPTPPVGRNSDPPDEEDLVDEGDASKRSRDDEAPEQRSEDD